MAKKKEEKSEKDRQTEELAAEFLKEVQALEKKHKFKLVAHLQYTSNGVFPAFQVSPNFEEDE
jgi:hypothetical protein